MNILTEKEVIYCSYCGSANKKSAVKCCECEKDIYTLIEEFIVIE